MTLTMTLGANALLVQSADHRLSRLDGSLYDDEEPKQLLVQSMGRQASVVCYSGVGEVPGRGRASELLYSAVSALDTHASLQDVAEAVREAGTRWLRGVSGDRRHSFTLAGLVVRPDDRVIETHVGLISNRQRVREIRRSRALTEDTDRATDDFVITWLDEWDDGEPVLLATGTHQAVHDGEALRLTRLVRSRRSTAGLARAMATVNRTAAGRSTAISPNCTTASFLLGRTQINGMSLGHTSAGDAEVAIPRAICGFDLRTLLADVLAEVPNRFPDFVGTPQMRPSSSYAESLPFGTTGSPFAHPDDPLLR